MKRSIKIVGFAIVWVVIVLFLLVVVFGALGKRRQKRIAINEPKQAVEKEVSEEGAPLTSEPVMTPMPPLPPNQRQLKEEDAVSGSPQEPTKRTYTLTISEGELNSYLNDALVNIEQSGDNPIVSAKITLQEGVGILNAQWKKGQTLTAEIHVTADGKALTIDNLSVSEAGLLTDLFEKIAYDFLSGVLDNFIAAQVDTLDRIEIKTSELLLHYRWQ